MNGKIKAIGSGVLMVFALFGAVWALNDQFVPREVHEMWIAGIQQQMIQIQKGQQISAAQQQLWYWQQKSEELAAYCARHPNDQAAKGRLNEAHRKRDFWQLEVNKLLNP